MAWLRLTGWRALALIACGSLVAASAEELAIKDADLARYLFVPVFDILDCTDQGFIEPGEIDEHFPVLFNPMSGGETRVLDREAFVTSEDPAEAELQASLFARLDADRDERVSAREYRDGLYQLLEQMDGDGDYEVTMDELQAGAAAETVAD